MTAIDFRVRPPYGSFLKAVPYQNLERTEFVCQRIGASLPEAARQGSVEMMIQEMEQAGIQKAVIPARKTTPSYGMVDNKDVQHFIDLDPNRFIGFMGADPLEGRQALEEIEQLVIRGKFTGVVMEVGMLRRPLYADDKLVYPIYDLCQSSEIPVILINGANAGPDISYSSPLSVDHVAAAFPNLKLIVAHGGWPWVTEMLHVAWRRPNVYVSPDMYMVNFPGWQDYVTAANYTLRDRFLFGTAYPFVPFRFGLEYFTKSGILEDRLDDLVYYNAARLLGFK